MICGFGDEVYNGFGGGFGNRMHNNAYPGGPKLTNKMVA